MGTLSLYSLSNQVGFVWFGVASCHAFENGSVADGCVLGVQSWF